jgi:hypothetical protein
MAVALELSLLLTPGGYSEINWFFSIKIILRNFDNLLEGKILAFSLDVLRQGSGTNKSDHSYFSFV